MSAALKAVVTDQRHTVAEKLQDRIAALPANGGAPDDDLLDALRQVLDEAGDFSTRKTARPMRGLTEALRRRHRGAHLDTPDKVERMLRRIR